MAAPAHPRTAPRSRLRALPRPSPAIVTALALGALVVVSVLLRSQALHARYWIDEGLSVGIASHPVGEIPGLLRQDGSPPLYYMLLGAWVRVFDTGEADTHMLSLLFALACVPAAWLGGRRLFGERAGWLAAGLAALCPFLTYYAQETRMYSLVAVLSIVVTASFAAVFAQGRRGWLPVFSIAFTLLLYTHNWGLFLAVGSVVALGWLWRTSEQPRAIARDALIGYGLIALLYVPWLPTLLDQARHTGAPWSERPRLADVLSALTSVGGGAAPAMALALGAGAGVAVLVVPRRSPAARSAVAIGLLGLTGLVVAFAASQASPAWATRYFAVFLGPLLLLGGAGLARAGRFGLVVAAILVLLWLDPRTSQLRSKSNAHFVADEIAPRLERGDLVVVAHPEQGPLMHFYLQTAGAPRLRWADALGPVPDPQIFDWRDALDRLRAARPRPTADALLRGMSRGEHVLLIQPIIRSARWGAPWTELVRRRAAQWERALDRDQRLRRTLAAPHIGRGPIPRGVRAVLYERR